MHWEQQVQYASISDIGFRRRNNQDSCIVQICSDRQTWHSHGHLFLVADGMGGHAVGELASKIAADTLPHTFYKLKEKDVSGALKTAIEAANAAIYERGSHNRDFQRMGTTCTALTLSSRGAVVGHVGDSRVYRIRGGRIDQLSFDHSLQWELLRQGKMKPEEVFLYEPRNVITRSLGPEEKVQVDIEGPYAVFAGDTYVLCSDGLTGHVNDNEIGMIAGLLSPGDACRLLVNLANLRGGSDNITVVIVRVGEVPKGILPQDIQNQPSQDGGMSWQWLVGFWGVAAAFVLGVLLVLFGKTGSGVTLAALAVLAAVGLFSHWWEKTAKSAGGSDPEETIVWRPYRTASAKFSRKLLNHLAAVESELERTAQEEGWSIDEREHELAYERAKAAMADKQSTQALCEYGKAIDVLMSGVHLHRKQLNREAKWGKNASQPTPPRTHG